MVLSKSAQVGLGTYRVTDYDACFEAVTTALDVGYRKIDTAEAYQNERAVGDAIAKSDVDRDDVFLATKVLHPKFAEGYTTDAVLAAAKGCFDRLGVGRVDLLYGVHWPGVGYDPEATFSACKTIYEEGLANRIGVCNLTIEQLETARAISSVPITVVQVEAHPLLKQAELLEYCTTHNIDFVAYAPIGNGRILEVPEIQTIAEANGASPAQVSLAWLRQRGAVAIPKSTNPAHIRENFESLTIELDTLAIETIDGLAEERQYDPDYAPAW